ALGPEDHVADPVIPMHDGERPRARPPWLEPAKRELERGMRIGRDRAVDLLVAGELGRGGGLAAGGPGGEGEARAGGGRGGGLRGGERGGQGLRGERILGVAEEPPRQRLAVDEIRDEERAADDRRIVLAPARARNREAARLRGPQEHELVAPARLEVVARRV